MYLCVYFNIYIYIYIYSYTYIYTRYIYTYVYIYIYNIYIHIERTVQAQALACCLCNHPVHGSGRWEGSAREVMQGRECEGGIAREGVCVCVCVCERERERGRERERVSVCEGVRRRECEGGSTMEGGSASKDKRRQNRGSAGEGGETFRRIGDCLCCHATCIQCPLYS